MSNNRSELLSCENCGKKAVVPPVIPGTAQICTECRFKVPGEPGRQTLHNGARVVESAE